MGRDVCKENTKRKGLKEGQKDEEEEGEDEEEAHDDHSCLGFPPDGVFSPRRVKNRQRERTGNLQRHQEGRDGRWEERKAGRKV